MNHVLPSEQHPVERRRRRTRRSEEVGHERTARGERGHGHTCDRDEARVKSRGEERRGEGEERRRQEQARGRGPQRRRNDPVGRGAPMAMYPTPRGVTLCQWRKPGVIPLHIPPSTRTASMRTPFKQQVNRQQNKTGRPAKCSRWHTGQEQSTTHGVPSSTRSRRSGPSVPRHEQEVQQAPV